MIKAVNLSLDVDLRKFSQYLNSQGFAHRIIEESGQQVLYVNSEQEAGYVRQALDDWDFSATDSHPPGHIEAGSYSLLNSIWRGIYNSPVTLALIAICCIVAAVSLLGARADRVGFLFFPLLASDGLFDLLTDIVVSPTVLPGTLAPMFLHFGELHLIFNMLWLWYFGKQLEAIHSSWFFLLLVAATSFISNTTQYLYSDSSNFGGMSGVVYGLVGYTWVIHRFMPRSYLLLNPNMFAFFVVALVLMELLASSWIATAAHIGGLVAGLAIGLLVVVYYRQILGRSVVGEPRRRIIN